MFKIYIASSLDNIPRVKEFQKKFFLMGAQITYDWTQHGRIESVEKLSIYGQLELSGVMEADLLFFLQPGRYGSHVELGAMIATIHFTSLGHGGPQKPKSIVMLEEHKVEPKTFYYLPCVHRFEQEQPALDFISGKINEHSE